VAIDAACSESWDVSSRAGHDIAEAARSAADFDGLDALLSRTRDGGERVIRENFFRSEQMRAGKMPALPWK